jgi:hypothetical protein
MSPDKKTWRAISFLKSFLAPSPGEKEFLKLFYFIGGIPAAAAS